MDIYALADLHLGEELDKAMDKFGDEWKNHSRKIKESWENTVKADDTVLVPGDISWAMNLDEAKPHMDFLLSLPGKKILLRGNHDYWWSSVSRLNGLYSKQGMFFLQNDCFMLDDGTAVCGSRLWKNEFQSKEDEKIYKRELIRSRLSLESAVRKNCRSIIFMGHYPPLLSDGKETEITEILKQYPVKTAVYGHLHGKDNFSMGFKGEKNGIEYRLVSADFVGFKPVKI